MRAEQGMGWTDREWVWKIIADDYALQKLMKNTLNKLETDGERGGMCSGIQY